MNISAIRNYIRENSERWEQIAESHPNRLVNVLRLAAPTAKNALDTHMDMYPAMEALGGIISTGGAKWQHLIRSGITESLCHLLAEVPNFGHCDDPEDDKTTMSSWYPALKSLRLGAEALKSDRSSAATKQFTSTVKKNWVMMMTRIWGDPQWSLFPQCSFERIMFATFVNIMTYLDVSMISIIDRETDLTVTLLARYWPSCSDETDFIATAHILSELVQSPNSRIAEYRRSHPVSPSVIPRILRSVNGSTSVLLTDLGNMLPLMNRTQAGYLLTTLSRIISNGLEKKTESSAAFFKPLLRHKALWKHITAVLANLDANDVFTPSSLTLLPDGTENPECQATVAVNRTNWNNVPFHIFTLFIATLRVAHKEFASEVPTFLKVLIRTNLFDVLDEVVPKMKTIPSFVDAVSSFFCGLGDMQDEDPSLRPILRSQFPRPRTLRALLDAAHGPNQEDMAQSLSNFTFVVTKDNVDAGRATAAGWITMYDFEQGIKARKRCDRRGCRGRVRATCKGCTVAGYCGTECQKLDWNEHRLICGFRAMTTSDSSTIAYLTYPKRFLDTENRDPSASGHANASLPALITSRDLSDYLKGFQLRSSEAKTKVNRLRDERRHLKGAEARLTRETEERRRQLYEDQTLTEEDKGQIESEMDAEFIREQKVIHDRASELLEGEAEVIRWASWASDCAASNKPVMQMMFEERERADRGWS